MKHGKTLQELAAEVVRQRESAQDYVADTRNLQVYSIGGQTYAQLPQVHLDGRVNDIADRQLAEYAGVPFPFYERLRNEYQPEFAQVVNAILVKQGDRRLVRTLDGNVRAFLSDRYRRLDNAELLESVLPVLTDFPGIEIASCEVTEKKLYLKIVYPKVEGEVRVGEVVQAGVVVSNSEVGHGSFSIQSLIYKLACKNGLITGSALKKAHLGRRLEEEGVIDYSDEAKFADDKALYLKTRDVLRAALNGVTFEENLLKLREAAGQKIEGNPVKAVELLAKKVSLIESEKDSVLRHLIEGADLSRWGLVNAVTRAAQDVSSYDRSTELEAIGHRVIELPASDWRELAKAA